ncbi:hypothetical protein EF908_34495 [Streptomyces sp. WAC04770]|nr:hypothetical protein [Streptomyces sp. WAC04770]RST17409.1 hypothetical protein EF908_34495 [Streptomyces sp. WAC04770]
MKLEPEITVGDVLDALSTCDRMARVRMAVNPFYPMAHLLGGVIESRAENGESVVYFAESKEAVQLGPLPPDVAVTLTWQPPNEAPARRRRGTTRPSGDQ